MNGLGDLAVATSTRFEVWFREAFNETVAVVEARLGRLLAKIEMGDFEGDRVQIDWIGGVPGLRQWIDEKRAQELLPHSWTVVVKDWEGTVRFKLNTLSDSRGNLYEPRIRGMAINAARHPCKAVSELVRLGDTTVCYDGQYYFDTDHLEGSSGTQSNKLTGTGTSLAQVRTDYFAAKSALMQFVDDQGEEIWMGDFRPLIWAPATGPIMEAFETLRGEDTLSLSNGSQSNNTLRSKFDIEYDPRMTDLNNWVMFNPDSPMKPLVHVEREPIHYVDNFGSGSRANPDVWSAKVAEAGVEGRNAYDYGMWQSAVLTVN